MELKVIFEELGEEGWRYMYILCKDGEGGRES